VKIFLRGKFMALIKQPLGDAQHAKVASDVFKRVVYLTAKAFAI
jgi:hypothetical protein